MANPTDKYDPATPGDGQGGTTNGPQLINSIPPGFVFYDSFGNVIKTVELDENNQARFSKTLTADDFGPNGLQARFNGSSALARGQKQKFNQQIGSGTNSKSPYVTKIVAGPGIYISAPNGQGVVTISTEPISSTITDDDLFNVTWTISDGTAFKTGTDLSQFTIGGANGIVMRSRDGITTVDCGAKLSAVGGGFLSFASVPSLQSSEFPDYGLIYFCPQDVDNQDGPPTTDAMLVTWGSLGHKNSSGVYVGDALKLFSSDILENGQPLTAEDIDHSNVFYKSGSFNDALFLMFTQSGAIFRTQGLPFDFYDASTSDGTASPKTWTRELDAANGRFWQSASNLADNSFSSYRICVSDSFGKIWYSDRTNANASTWTSVNLGTASIYGMAYAGGQWIAAGFNDRIFRSTNGSTWTETRTGWGDSDWREMAYGNGKFVVVGNGGRIAFSTDNGVTWTRANSGTKEDLYSIAYSPTLNKFMAVGKKRTIVTVDG